MVGELTLSVGTQQKQTRMRLASCQVTEQIEAGAIGSLEIIKDEDERMRSADGFQKRANGFKESQTCLLRRRRRGNTKITQAHGQFREETGKNLRGRSNLFAQVIQRGDLDVLTKRF